MFPAPREWRELLKETYGTRVGGGIFHVVVGGAVSVALVAIIGLIALVKSRIVDPVLQSLPSPSLPSDFLRLVLPTFVSAALVGLAAASSIWWFRRWETRLIRAISAYVERSHDRLARIEANAPSVESVTERIEHIEARIDALEAHTDISGARKAFIDLLMKRESEKYPNPHGGQ